jgi:hypothetical protein
MANVYAAVRIEEGRAAKLAKLDQNQAVLILQTGART